MLPEERESDAVEVNTIYSISRCTLKSSLLLNAFGVRQLIAGKAGTAEQSVSMSKHSAWSPQWIIQCGFRAEVEVLNVSTCITASALSLSSWQSLSPEEDWMMWHALWGDEVVSLSMCSWKKQKILKEPWISHSCSIPRSVCHPKCVLVNGSGLAERRTKRYFTQLEARGSSVSRFERKQARRVFS